MKTEPNTTSPHPAPLRAHLLRQCEAMVRHAFASGLSVPGSLVQTLQTAARSEDESTGIQPLAQAHGRLSQIVAPATPRSILVLTDEATTNRLLRFLGPVALVRRMMLVALVSLAVFILAGLSSHVNAESGDIMISQGWELLLNLVFFLAAAGLGASFFALFQVNRYIVEGTFDPKYETSYWIQFILGLISGILLSQLAPVDLQGSAVNLTRASLAMLGGFSVRIVYRILSRLVETVESLVRGETREILAARELVTRARLEEQAAQSRMKLMVELVELKGKLGAGAASGELEGILEKLLNGLGLDELKEERVETAPAQEGVAGQTS